ncbi:MAG: OmpA family protein, partial [Psychromonas sp.]|nr:OmpA family protein [Psychromonas sp.]
MTDNNQPLSFKKSVLSIVIISAVTGGLIACAKQQKLAQSFPTEVNQVLLENSIGSSERQEAALIAPAESQEDEQVAPLLPTQQVDAELAIHNEVVSASVSEQAVQETTQGEADKRSAIDYQLLFALNSSEIDASYYSSLNDIAALMKTADADPQMLWQVVGYTDPSGSAQYNMQLAEKRAQTVVEFLVDKGVAREKLA